MSILTEINRLQNAKADIVSAIESKGVSVDNAATMDDMATYIHEIDQASDSVRFTPQTLEESEKLQARINIGIGHKVIKNSDNSLSLIWEE